MRLWLGQVELHVFQPWLRIVLPNCDWILQCRICSASKVRLPIEFSGDAEMHGLLLRGMLKFGLLSAWEWPQVPMCADAPLKVCQASSSSACLIQPVCHGGSGLIEINRLSSIYYWLELIRCVTLIFSPLASGFLPLNQWVCRVGTLD